MTPPASPSASAPSQEVERFRSIFRRIHAGHPGCLADEWLEAPCADAAGRPADRPVVWSRRNGPWRRVDILWVGAAPGNAGGRGAGDMGAHATRIPFGGDVAGANLDALFGSIGLTRNDTFVVAALNQLPAAGGGEPTRAELAAPVGGYPTSLHVLRDTLLAAGPRLVVALGNVGLRTLIAAARLDGPAAWREGSPERATGTLRLPSLERLRRAGFARGEAVPWPGRELPSDDVRALWRAAWGDASLPRVLWLTHPSAQNMSPFAGTETAFHTRMVEARDALARAVRATLARELPRERPHWPEEGIYALADWRQRVGPRHRRLDRLWREKGV
ncbi:MAG TPA: uracil-DNA glycosylase family protein [Longimicrobiales bacterium]|nr:uracil-DNA glycosylase family protein [Longimicrobiales bacterium]